MPDPQTPNLGLFIPLNGADVGTWDVPMNANFSALDNALGAASNVGVTNVNIVLSPSQYACLFINFTGVQTGSVSVQFPALQRMWIVRNGCTNNTTFIINTVVGLGFRSPCLPPNETVMLQSDGTGNLDILGLGRIGSYMDFAGSAVPAWIAASTPAPYLNCDGTSFSSATYPALRDYLGTNTLPDARGRFRAALDQATGRLTGSSSLNGLNGNTLLAGGGSQTIGQTNIPSYALTVTDTHTHNYQRGTYTTLIGQAGVDILATYDFGETTTLTSTTAGGSITVNSGGSGNSYAPPGYVGGLTLIRAG